MDQQHTGPSSRERTFSWSDPRAAAAAGATLSGMGYLQAMQEGRLPRPPALALLDAELGVIEQGRVTMRLVPQEFHFNPLASVHGGITATLLDSVMGCAVHSTLLKGRGYTTLEIKVNYLRAITDATGEVTAEGRIVHSGRQVAVAEGTLVDARGRIYATASTTCLLFDRPDGGAPASGLVMNVAGEAMAESTGVNLKDGG